MNSTVKFQIGKNGVTPGVIDSLLLIFKSHKRVRISVLKASGRDRNSIVLLAEDLSKGLSEKAGGEYTFKIIGFTIILTRHLSRITKK